MAICGNLVIFQDDFSTALNWVQTGTQVTIASGEIQGWGADSTDQRLTHDLVTPISDKSWTVEFEYEFSAFTLPAHDILVITDTNGTSGALQDYISVRFGFTGALIQFGLLHGGNGQIGTGSIMPITASINTRYFVRLQRISFTVARLTVFTGGFDSVLFGTIDVDLNLFGGPPTGMQFVQSQTSDLGGAGRNLTGIIDNLVITNACCNFEVNALIQSQGDVRCSGGSVFFFDGMDDASQWTSNTGQIVPNDIAGVMEWNSLTGGATVNERFAFRTIPNFADNIGEIRIRVKVDKISGSGPTAPTGRFLVLQNNALHPKVSTGSSFELFIGSGQSNGGIACGLSDGTSSINTTPQLNFNNSIKFLEGVYDPVGQTLTLNVYTDAGFSIHDTGSPVQIDASSISMTGLTFTHMITSNVKNSGPARVITADLDDFSIGGSASCPTAQVNALLQTQGDNGSCIGTYTDLFTSATGWISTDTTPPGFQTVTGGKLSWEAVADNSNDSIAIDLSDPTRLGSTLSDNFFRVRNKVTFTGAGVFSFSNHEFFGVSDSDQTVNYGTGSEDAIGWHLRIGGSQTVRAFYKDGSSAKVEGTTFDINSIPSGAFFEIIRNSSTSITWNIYNDSGYTNLVFTYTDSSVPASVTGLQYWKVGNWKFSNLDNVLTGSFDNLDILSEGAVGNVACPEVDAILISPKIFEFTVNSLIQAQGENGNCPIPATETFYSRAKSQALAERLGEGVNSPFAGITRAGVRIAGATHAGKAIEDYRVLGIRRNGVGATGSLFATVRSQDDTVIAISTNSVLAESLPTTGSGNDVTFTFDNKVVLQDGYRILLEFPNCIGCADSASEPNVFWFGTSTASPAGTERTFFGKSPTTSGSYFETTVGFTQGGVISFTTSPAEPANQRACANVDALLRATFIEEFEVDAFVFILPVHNTFVNAILQAFDQEKEFTIDGCLQADLSVEFEVDACIETEGKRFFQVDAFVFILPVANAIVDAIVRYAQGTRLTGGIPDLIIRVLRENPPSLKGREIVDEIVKITSDPAEGFSFRGKTSRIKNWLNRLRLDNLIQEDGSNPDWYRTNWSLV